jgi:hypothetical protein
MPIFISGATSLCRKIYEIYVSSLDWTCLRVQNCYHLYQFIVGISSALKSDFNFFEALLALDKWLIFRRIRLSWQLVGGLRTILRERCIMDISLCFEKIDGWEGNQFVFDIIDVLSY